MRGFAWQEDFAYFSINPSLPGGELPLAMPDYK